MAVNARLDVAAIKKDFPILDREINGKRLVYLDSAASSQKPAGARRDGALLRDDNANVHRGVYQIAAEATERYESRAAEGRAVHRRADASASRLHQERHRGPQPRRPLLGPRQPARRRRRRAHRDGAPRQHRALAHARGRARHRAALDPADRRRRARPHRPRPAARRGEAVQLHRDVERARHAHPGPPARRRGSRRRGGGDRRRLPVRPPPAHRRASRSAPTSSASPATRCAGPPASACCGDARSCSTRCRRSSAAAR